MGRSIIYAVKVPLRKKRLDMLDRAILLHFSSIPTRRSLDSTTLCRIVKLQSQNQTFLGSRLLFFQTDFSSHILFKTSIISFWKPQTTMGVPSQEQDCLST